MSDFTLPDFGAENLIEKAFQEDLPQGDLTTKSLGVEIRRGRARLVARSDLVLSGITLFEKAFLKLEPEADFQWFFHDGDEVLSHQNLCIIQGNLIQFLKAERVALNILSRLSGISSLTLKFVEATKDTSCKILDTRKTCPGWRHWEKQAVKHGKGFNHRLNLSEAILIKENHIAIAGGIREAIKRIRMRTKMKYKIEIEVKNEKEVKEAVSERAERILLDNMTKEEIKKALQLIPPSIEVEVSGNMTIEKIKEIAPMGVHFISVGALTHSAPAANLTLLFDWIETS